LFKKEETEDEDAWNIAMAAGTCLGLISTTVMDDIVPHVLPFVTKHIQDENWRFREAATFAFGALLEGPQSETLEPYISGVCKQFARRYIDYVLIISFVAIQTQRLYLFF